MGSMPTWFAKTPEMIASDKYFSLDDAGSEQALVQRYEAALNRLQQPNYYTNSDALQKTGWSATAISDALEGHFRGDWIHTEYPDPSFAAIGGRYWPQVPSRRVVDRIKIGTVLAIQKALGFSVVVSGASSGYADTIFRPELTNGIDLEGVRPLSTSWICVAPTGENYFEVDSLRGPSVVEFLIATPRPYGHGMMMPVVEAIEAELIHE